MSSTAKSRCGAAVATRKARTACAHYPGQRGNLCHDKPEIHTARISVRKPRQEEGHENWWPGVTSVSVASIVDGYIGPPPGGSPPSSSEPPAPRR